MQVIKIIEIVLIAVAALVESGRAIVKFVTYINKLRRQANSA